MQDYLVYLEKTISFNENLPIQTLIYNALRTGVISGQIPIGVRLNEMQIARHLNISRTPIREAIRQLTFEGLLENIPNFGTTVRKITVDDIIEVYKLRVALETLAFSSAMENITQDDFEYFDQLTADTLKANEDKDYDRVIELTRLYNLKVLQLAQMPRLSELLKNLKDYLHRFRVISMTSEHRGKIAIEEHRLLIKAMKNKNTEQIRMIIEEHLSYSKDCIIEYVLKEEEEQLHAGRSC